jgi:hypothetical protein
VGFRFRRTVRILPGLRLNLSRSGASVSLGPKGFHYTVGPKGTRVTAGIPGTGMFWTEYSPYGKNSNIRTRVPSNGTNSAFRPSSINIPPNDQTLTPVESAAPDAINALSTSEIAQILNSIQRRIRFAPIVFAICLALVVFAFNSGDNHWINLSALFTVTFVPLSILLDRYRRSIAIKYEFQGVANTVAHTLAETFNELKGCSRVWSVIAEGRVDRKRNAGANTRNQRKKIYPRFGRPNCLRGYVKFPALKLGRQELYFIPDAILVVTRGSVAALTYQELIFSNNKIRFIETEPVPRDASVVGETWRYVNKNGGPDRRFKFNRTLPICSYGEMEFKSESGLNCKIEYSNPSQGDRFSKALEILHRPGSHIHSKAITSAKAPHRWPSVIFVFFFLLSSAALVEPILIDANMIKSLHTLVPFKK